MSSPPEQFNVNEHDWHAADYVDKWIARDRTREERVPVLKEMMTFAPFAADAELNVLDVGAGNGAVSARVLEAFPRARLTMQDYSQPMLDRAREDLRQFAARLRFEQADFTDPAWTKNLGGPFDLAVSGIAIHNLFDNDLIAGVYRAIFGVLKPGGAFLEVEHFGRIGGVELHLGLLGKSGFTKVEKKWQKDNTAVVIGFKP